MLQTGKGRAHEHRSVIRALAVILFCSAWIQPILPAPGLKIAQVNGVRLAYRVDGQGFPVVLIHGETFTHELWSRQVEALSKEYRVISYDRRGHGQSEAPKTGYSPVDHAQDLEALVQMLGVSKAHFVAHSRGGTILLQLLRLDPDLVCSLAFVDASIPLVELPEGKKEAIQRIREGVLSREDAFRQREAAKTRFFLKVAGADPSIRQILNRMVDQFSPNVYLNPLKSDLTSPLDIGPWSAGDFPEMNSSGKSILLVAGELTDPYFIDAAREADRQWPETQYHLIPGTDHLLMLESPGMLNRLLLNFLDEVGDCGTRSVSLNQSISRGHLPPPRR